ncbi:MAG: zinc ribbon domain-containing protein [Candidatus Bathyarchaeia archaeon]
MSRPTVAFGLSLAGGIIVLIVGLFLMVLGAVATFLFLGIGGIIGLFGVVCGIFMIMGAIMLYTRPEQHVAWGTIVLVFSILSWFGALAGLVIGFILGLVGGILGIIWRPQTFAAPSTLTRYCPACGRSIDPTVKYCPHCGRELP